MREIQLLFLDGILLLHVFDSQLLFFFILCDFGFQLLNFISKQIFQDLFFFRMIVSQFLHLLKVFLLQFLRLLAQFFLQFLDVFLLLFFEGLDPVLLHLFVSSFRISLLVHTLCEQEVVLLELIRQLRINLFLLTEIFFELMNLQILLHYQGLAFLFPLFI